MQRILFAADGSDDAAAAARFLTSLPLAQGTAIRVVSVANEFPDNVYAGLESLAGVRRVEWDWASSTAETAKKTLAREGLDVRAMVRTGPPASEILDESDEFAADLVVLGSRGLSGVGAFMLGSVSESVAKHARCPVLVARAPHNELRQVLLAADGSEYSERAVEFTAQLPLPTETQVVAAHVVRPYRIPHGFMPTSPFLFDQLEADARHEHLQAAEGIVGRAQEALASAGKSVVTRVRDGNPAKELLKLASERDADLIIAGARGASLIRALAVGSIADRLLRHARCSVLIVR